MNEFSSPYKEVGLNANEVGRQPKKDERRPRRYWNKIKGTVYDRKKH